MVDEVLFWFVLLSPIWLAILIRLLPISGRRGKFLALLGIANLAPHVAVFLWLGADLEAFFGYIIVFFLNFWIGFLTLPALAFLLGVSGAIILSHPGIEKAK